MKTSALRFRCLETTGRWLPALLLLAVARAVEPAPVALGPLERFWRYSAVLGPLLEQGYALEVVPAYLTEGDFPYPKRPYSKEVLFADHLSVVRLLGGYNDRSQDGPGDPAVRERDLAWRDQDGKIRYRMELLRPRLQPWLDAGYTDLTLVLDNVPWCFPAQPGIRASYGQGVAPRDEAEWGEFVRALCREVSAILGPEAANRLRFRVGTENNGKERFDGTQEQYLRHYEASARAVQTVLPGAKVGPFNIAGISLAGVARHNVNGYALAEFAATRALPYDWVSYTRYFRPGEDPAWHAQTCREVWAEFERRVPSLKGVSREIHEFGVAPWGEVAKGVFPSAEPGANGGALTSQMMWHLRAAGINRLWHWLLGERIRDRGDDTPLLTGGPAWVLSVLEHMAGGEAFLIEPATKPPADGKFLAAVSVRGDRTLLMISAYHPDIAEHTRTTVDFRLPARLLPSASGERVRATWLTRETSPYDAIRRDLAAADLLAGDFVQRPDRLGNVKQMAEDRNGTALVAAQLPKYRQIWVDSLTLKPLDPALGTVTRDAGGLTVTVHLVPPAVLVLELR
jgi:hypothetical protein